jgi:uncharacterized protein
VIRSFLFLPLLVLGSAACDAQAPAGHAAPPPPIVQVLSGSPLPALTGRVVDRAGILGAPAEAALDARLAALEKETSDQLVVVTVPSLEDEPINEFGLRLGRGWGVGQKGLDNVVLVIVAPAERQARIEVGYGLEELLTDEHAAQILKDKMIPSFRKGQMERAVDDGVAAIVAILTSDTGRPRGRPRTSA